MEEGKNQIRKISQTRVEGKKYCSYPHKLTLPTLCSSPKLPGLQRHFQLPIPWHTFYRFSLHNLFLNQDFLPWQGRGGVHELPHNVCKPTRITCKITHPCMDILSEEWVYRFHQILKEGCHSKHLTATGRTCAILFQFLGHQAKPAPVLPFLNIIQSLDSSFLSSSPTSRDAFKVIFLKFRISHVDYFCLLIFRALRCPLNNVQIPRCRHHSLFISVSSISGWLKRFMLLSSPDVRNHLCPSTYLSTVLAATMFFHEIYFPTNSVIWISVGSLNIICVFSPCIL